MLTPPLRTGDLAADKAAWRTALRAARRQVVRDQGPEGRLEHGCTLTAHALAWLDHHLDGLRGRTLTAYEDLPTEPPVAGLVTALRARGARVLLPITLGAGLLDWYDAADPGRVGLGSTVLAEVDVALVPALAVDRHGARLGKGGGYYDRALPLLPERTWRLAVLHDHELVDWLPSGPRDTPVDAVLTAAAGVAPVRTRASG